MDRNNYEREKDILEMIIGLANRENDVAQFGISVANILIEHGCIDSSVYNTIIGK